MYKLISVNLVQVAFFQFYYDLIIGLMKINGSGGGI